MNLLEAYKRKIAVAESLYSRNHRGATLSQNQKIAIATVYRNTEKFLNEQLATTAATQAASMGQWKKFCLALSTIVTPNLIANDLVIVSPMSSISGYVTYIEYTAGVNKGVGVGDHMKVDDTLANPWEYQPITQSKYTGAAVVEAVASFTSGTTKVAWTPVIAGTIRALDANGDVVSTGTWTAAADGTITADTYATGKSATDVAKIAYEYDNIVIPQEKLPTVKAEMKSIPLVAKARRVAVYYSQIAAFEAKTDYGIDLGASLAEQAANQLAYEIDTEVVELLAENAVHDNALDWTPASEGFTYVSRSERYEGFAEKLQIAAQKIYDATHRFMPNYVIIASDLMPIMVFLRGFKAAEPKSVNGPYLAGTFNGSMKVFVSPVMASGEYVVGVNGNDMMSAAAVYAPYMPIVPTQLLGFADGGMGQGFSTMYDLKLLNAGLLAKGKVTL